MGGRRQGQMVTWRSWPRSGRRLTIPTGPMAHRGGRRPDRSVPPKSARTFALPHNFPIAPRAQEHRPYRRPFHFPPSCPPTRLVHPRWCLLVTCPALVRLSHPLVRVSMLRAPKLYPPGLNPQALTRDEPLALIARHPPVVRRRSLASRISAFHLLAFPRPSVSRSAPVPAVKGPGVPASRVTGWGRGPGT